MATRNASLQTTLQSFAARAPGIWRLDACGITRADTPIPALIHLDAYVPSTPRRRVLLLGGLSGHTDDAMLAFRALETYLDAGPRLTDTVALSAVPVANPDGLAMHAAPENGAGGMPATGYPPAETFFYDAQNPERAYLWRWIGLHAPDVLLEVRAGDTVTWEASAAAAPLAAALQATALAPTDALLAALGHGTPNGLAPVPGLRLTTPAAELPAQLQRLWTTLAQQPAAMPSPARQVLDARRTRSALDIARLLATVYGHTLDPVVYTQGMAISGRLQLAHLDTTTPNPAPEIVQLVEPYVSGAVPALEAQAGTPALGGLVWGTDLAAATGDQRYTDLLVQIADRYQPGADGGAPPPSDPDFRTEDMCMNGMLLGRAFEATHNAQYLSLQTAFLLQARIQQDNGLFWHCRSAPYYWGRGNGFAAMGFCETLSYLSADHPDRQALLAMHQQHLDSLRQRQHLSGMYPQVLDVPGSYQEFTVTCMVGYAMARGLRRGWLDASYRPAVELAWQGVSERIDDAGGVLDACTNTGVQTSLRAYLDRPAVCGRDDRSGSMALWFALEMAQLPADEGER